MIKRLLNKRLGFSRKDRENYLTIEEIDDRFEITRAKIDHRKKTIRIIGQRTVTGIDKLRRPLFPVDRLVVALNSKMATTIESTVNLRRSDPQEVITEGELDGLIFKGLWDFLNHYRTWVAKKMGINELDLILANIEIKDVRLGGHKVFNPVGFRSRDFLMDFRGTFVPSDLLPVLEKMAKWSRDFVVIEGPSALASAVCDKRDFMIQVGRHKTEVFISNENERLFLRELPWGALNVVKSLAASFSVDDGVAEMIWEKYNRSHLSDRFRRLVERSFREEFQALFGLLEPIYSKFGSSIKPVSRFYFRFTAPIVDTLFNEPRFQLVSFYENLRREGYNISASKKLPFFSPKNYQSLFALLVYSHDHPQYAVLNQMLRRRAKWLISNT